MGCAASGLHDDLVECETNYGNARPPYRKLPLGGNPPCENSLCFPASLDDETQKRFLRKFKITCCGALSKRAEHLGRQQSAFRPCWAGVPPWQMLHAAPSPRQGAHALPTCVEGSIVMPKFSGYKDGHAHASHSPVGISSGEFLRMVGMVCGNERLVFGS